VQGCRFRSNSQASRSRHFKCGSCCARFSDCVFEANASAFDATFKNQYAGSNFIVKRCDCWADSTDPASRSDSSDPHQSESDRPARFWLGDQLPIECIIRENRIRGGILFWCASEGPALLTNNGFCRNQLIDCSSMHVCMQVCLHHDDASSQISIVWSPCSLIHNTSLPPVSLSPPAHRHPSHHTALY
jgi:hypothetical protein